MPFSPPPKTRLKLLQATIFPTISAVSLFSIFLPETDTPKTQIFFLKTTPNLLQIIKKICIIFVN